MLQITYDDPRPITPNAGVGADKKPVERKPTRYFEEQEKATTELPTYVHRVDEDVEGSRVKRALFWKNYRPFILAGVAVMIFGWWVSATVLKATRHRW